LPERVGQATPLVPQIGAAGHPLELPVHADERPVVWLYSFRTIRLEYPQIPGCRIDSELGREHERAIAQGFGRRAETVHARPIGTRDEPIETVPSDGGTITGKLGGATMRRPTVIVQDRLIAGRHPCAWGPENAPEEVSRLLDDRVTLFVDLTQEGELEPYAHLVSPARHVRMPIRDFSVPTPDDLVATLDAIDAELDAGGIVYVHCWAGCGRTGVVVGCWLVRRGLDPRAALAKIAEARGLGCPQTLEQRLLVLGWEAGR